MEENVKMNPAASAADSIRRTSLRKSSKEGAILVFDEMQKRIFAY